MKKARLRAKSVKQREIDAERRRIKERKIEIALSEIRARSVGGLSTTANVLRAACAASDMEELPVDCASPFQDRPFVELHEIVKRSRWRAGAVDADNCVLLCQAHHDYTEEFPDQATKLGLLARAQHVHPFDKFDVWKSRES